MAKKILIVDDNPQIVMLIASRLKANNYEVEAANDAVQAVAKALKWKPDLIILDIRMPAGGGLNVLESLKQSAITMTTPIIIITAYPSDEIMQEALEKGASDFISKPFDPEHLLAKIKRALGETV